MARNITRIIQKIVTGNYRPDTGRTLQIKTDATVPVLIATAAETPAASGQYYLTWTEQPLYGKFYLDGVLKENFGRIWLGFEAGNQDMPGTYYVSQSLGVKTTTPAFELDVNGTANASVMSASQMNALIDITSEGTMNVIGNALFSSSVIVTNNLFVHDQNGIGFSQIGGGLSVGTDLPIGTFPQALNVHGDTVISGALTILGTFTNTSGSITTTDGNLYVTGDIVISSFNPLSRWGDLTINKSASLPGSPQLIINDLSNFSGGGGGQMIVNFDNFETITSSYAFIEVLRPFFVGNGVGATQIEISSSNASNKEIFKVKSQPVIPGAFVSIFKVFSNGDATLSRSLQLPKLDVTQTSIFENSGTFLHGADYRNINGEAAAIFTDDTSNDSFVIGYNGTTDFIIGTGKSLFSAPLIDIDFSTGNTAFTGQPILASTSFPASVSASGITGQIAHSGSFLYLCTGSNAWVRFSGSRF